MKPDRDFVKALAPVLQCAAYSHAYVPANCILESLQAAIDDLFQQRDDLLAALESILPQVKADSGYVIKYEIANAEAVIDRIKNGEPT